MLSKPKTVVPAAIFLRTQRSNLRICLLLCIFGAVMSQDYYKYLGLNKKATDKEIKKAYRKRALKYHPDKVAEDEKEKAEEKFLKVSEAYAVLGDKEKRKVYDQYGKQGIDAMEKGWDPKQGGTYVFVWLFFFMSPVGLW